MRPLRDGEILNTEFRRDDKWLEEWGLVSWSDNRQAHEKFAW